MRSPIWSFILFVQAQLFLWYLPIQSQRCHEINPNFWKNLEWIIFKRSFERENWFFFFSLYRCLSNDILKRMKKGELKMKVPKDISRMILLKIFKLMKHEMFVIRGSFGLLNSKSKRIILIYVIIDMLYRNWFYVSYYWLNILHNKNIRTFNFFEWKIYALIISTLL